MGLVTGSMRSSFLATLSISAPVLLPAMFVGFAIALQVLSFAQMLFANGLDWKCFASGLYECVAPLPIAITPFGISLAAVVGMVLASIGVAEASFDFSGSREACMG